MYMFHRSARRADETSHDKKLSPEICKGLASTAEVSHEIRDCAPSGQADERCHGPCQRSHGARAAPAVTVYDCKQSQTLPGTPVPKPGSDATAKRS